LKNRFNGGMSMNNNSNKYNFPFLVLGQIITVFGSALLRFTLSLYVLDVTGRGDIFATLYAISSIPMLLSPVGGAISDRFNRKILMVSYDAICGVVTFLFLILVFRGQAGVVIIGVLMVVLGIIGAMETPNGMAALPSVVPTEKLEMANGVIQSVQSVSGIIAPVIGGILYGLLGINHMVLISGCAFTLAAAIEIFIKIPYKKRETRGNIFKTISLDLKDGFTYVWKDSFIRKFTFMAVLLNLIIAPCIIVVAPLIFRLILKASDTMYGVGMGAIEAATIIGALLVGLVSKKMKITTLWKWILAMAILFVPIGFSVSKFGISLGFIPSFSLFTLCVVIISAIATILSIYIIVRIQARTPDELLGKVMAIIQAVAQCAAPVGQFIYGEVFQRSKHIPYLTFGIACVFTILITVIGRIILANEGN
jgi:MFS family permease